MAVSIKELIEQKEAVQARKKKMFDLTTSIGVITIKQPGRAVVAETVNMEDSDPYLIMECVVEPNLKDKALLDAYECVEPTDLPGKLFSAGEVNAIARKIFECAGYRKDIQAEVHDVVKN